MFNVAIAERNYSLKSYQVINNLLQLHQQFPSLTNRNHGRINEYEFDLLGLQIEFVFKCQFQFLEVAPGLLY